VLDSAVPVPGRRPFIMASTGLLLLNLGTPDAPRTPQVRTYLRQFLSDPRVLDIPALQRWLVLNLFILPFRPKASAEAYRKIWTSEGSPLLRLSTDLRDRVAEALGGEVRVELAMRYQNPSIGSALARLRDAGVDRIVALPLFPQYSSSAWGSAVEELFTEAGKRWNVPFLQVVPPFYDDPGFLDSFAAVARDVAESFAPDYWLMSFHGLPERQVVKSDETGGRHCLQTEDCCSSIVAANRHCYRAQCFATARGLAERLGVSDQHYRVTFQSRLGRDPWIKPYTDQVIPELARSGVRRLAVMSPAFVADCLETLEELGMRAADDFRAAGGEELRLVPSLNATPLWVSTVVGLASRGTFLSEDRP